MKKAFLAFLVLLISCTSIFCQDTISNNFNFKNQDRIMVKPHRDKIMQFGDKLVDSIYYGHSISEKYYYNGNKKISTYIRYNAYRRLITKTHYRYTSNGDISEIFIERDTNGINQKISLLQNEYNQNNLMTSKTQYIWQDSSWVMTDRVLKSYDSLNRMISDSNSQSNRKYYFYDSLNRLISDSNYIARNFYHYIVNDKSSVLYNLPNKIEAIVNDTLKVTEYLTYNSFGSILTDSISVFKVYNSFPYWTTTNYTEYSYTNLNQVLSKFHIYRNVPTDRIESTKLYYYHNNFFSIYNYEYNQSASCVKKYFNVSGQLIKEEIYWAHDEDSWNNPNILQNITYYIYDYDNQLTKVYTDYYSSANWAHTFVYPDDTFTDLEFPYNSFKCFLGDNAEIFYTTLTAVEEQSKTEQLYLCNSSSDIVEIHGLSELTDFAIYDLTGTCCLSGKTSCRIDIANLSKGVYFIRLNNKTLKFLRY